MPDLFESFLSVKTTHREVHAHSANYEEKILRCLNLREDLFGESIAANGLESLYHHEDREKKQP